MYDLQEMHPDTGVFGTTLNRWIEGRLLPPYGKSAQKEGRVLSRFARVRRKASWRTAP
ncbi:MAG: hypothetical protein IPK07_06350 [Deltaproteobacteria bacterium]|nr:hypothetical protein [Deltaproteobacteria bacterium]